MELEVGIMATLLWGAVPGRRVIEGSGVLAMFCFLFWVLVTWMFL
jgi:hypothetical protein